jgi:hypothetical protein
MAEDIDFLIAHPQVQVLYEIKHLMIIQSISHDLVNNHQAYVMELAQ